MRISLASDIMQLSDKKEAQTVTEFLKKKSRNKNAEQMNARH
ncbi:hypothetical protein [Vibrio parahaemolyticus]|nr:hypothetical protein [Vibrio parahaemolyticus]MDA0393525.1 hypothetical protein [Vibrio parahaemolyticus]MDA0398393.1 hypothetical protein [Vibrio parahaemolyticus]MDA0402901.1 hypothetical protein [Vibrio parahaemolyticus]